MLGEEREEVLLLLVAALEPANANTRVTILSPRPSNALLLACRKGTYVASPVK